MLVEMEQTTATPNTNATLSPSTKLIDFIANDGNEQDVSVVISIVTEVVFLTFIMVASVVSNSLVFVIFYQRPTLRTLSNRFVLNLATCDLLYSLIVIPYVTATVLVTSPTNDVTSPSTWWWCWCTFSKAATTLLALGCTLAVLLIAIDRYCAVMNPLHYSMRVTRARCTCAIVIAWITAVVIATLPLPLLLLASETDDVIIGGGGGGCDATTTTITSMVTSSQRALYSSLVTGTGFALPLAAILFIYCRMYRAARASSVRVRRHSATTEATSSGGTEKPRRCSSNGSVSIVLFREESRAAQTGALVIVTFVFFWLPYFLFVLLEAHPTWRPTSPTLGRTLAQHLTFVGCALNPFVYAYRNRIVWRDARHVLHCNGRRHQQQQQHSNVNNNYVIKKKTELVYFGQQQQPQQTRSETATMTTKKSIRKSAVRQQSGKTSHDVTILLDVVCSAKKQQQTTTLHSNGCGSTLSLPNQKTTRGDWFLTLHTNSQSERALQRTQSEHGTCRLNKRVAMTTTTTLLLGSILVQSPHINNNNNNKSVVVGTTL